MLAPSRPTLDRILPLSTPPSAEKMSESLADPTGRKPTVIFFKKVLNTAVADQWSPRRFPPSTSGWSFHTPCGQFDQVACPGENQVRTGLPAGGRWIRTSSTRTPNRVIPLLCCSVAWEESARAPVSLGRYDLTREEIWVNIILRDGLHGLKEPARDPGGASVGAALPDDLDADRHAFDR